MYTDINDLAADLFGREIVAESLRKNGGASIWDLYFDVAESHAVHYRSFQKSFFISNDSNLYIIDDLFLIPGCIAEKNRPVMSSRDAERIIGRLRIPLSAREYRKTVLFLCEFRIQDQQLTELLNKSLENRKSEFEGGGLIARKTICRQRMAKLFPLWSDVIFDSTAEAMNIFNDIVSAKEEMNRLFRKSLGSGFSEEMTLPGSVLWASWTRNYPAPGKRINRDIAEELGRRFEDTYLSDHLLPSDNEDFWREQADFVPDEVVNSLLFSRQMPSSSIRKENEHLLHLEYLFGKNEKLEKYYQRHQEKIIMTYMIEKPLLDHVLLKRMADARCDLMTLHRQEFLLLFINRFPGFEGRRKLMSENTVNDLQKYLVTESREISLTDLLWLLHVAYRERPDEETLISWTQLYFETELSRLS